MDDIGKHVTSINLAYPTPSDTRCMPIYPFYILPGDPPRMYSSPLQWLLSIAFQSFPVQ